MLFRVQVSPPGSLHGPTQMLWHMLRTLSVRSHSWLLLEMLDWSCTKDVSRSLGNKSPNEGWQPLCARQALDLRFTAIPCLLLPGVALMQEVAACLVNSQPLRYL